MGNEVCRLNILDSVPICAGCMAGQGEECHSPGCVLWMRRCPDLEIRTSLRTLGTKCVRHYTLRSHTDLVRLGAAHRCDDRSATPIKGRRPETKPEGTKAWVAAWHWIANHGPLANREPDPDAVRDLAETILKGGND